MASIIRLMKGKTVSGVFKQAWDEIPEVVGSSFLALFGIGLATVGVYQYYAMDGDNRRYKLDYIVYRPDDPRVEKIRKD
ncbi:uncharacterized protein NdufA3 [Periplaneta americana]|uniref:uncharacterized protein NdufA3 n=1 Tax=Periplaneta americana TaxID=6978 RepID=UPI0037E92414